MGLFNNFPYMDLSNLNLDFILKKLKDLNNYVDSAAQDAETAVNAKDEAVAAKEAAQLSAENAASSEENAGQSAETAQNYAEHIADPVGGLVTGWLDDNITPTTPPVDASLTVQGAAADAKAAGDAIRELRGQIDQLEVIPYDVKLAMDNMFKEAMYLSDVSNDYAAFHAWAAETDLVSISAVFNQGANQIYDADSLDSLRQYLTVTASYGDGSNRVISSYTLSGSLAEGTSAITAAYEGKTAIFNVTVSATPTLKVFTGKGVSGSSITDNVNRALSEPLPFTNTAPITIRYEGYTAENAKMGFKNTTTDINTIDTSSSIFVPASDIGQITQQEDRGWIHTTDDVVLAMRASDSSEWVATTFATTSGYARLLFANAQDMSVAIPSEITGIVRISGKPYRLSQRPSSEF